jgi:hypothetical protein
MNNQRRQNLQLDNPYLYKPDTCLPPNHHYLDKH